MDEIISIVVGFIATALVTIVLVKVGCKKEAAMIGGEIVGKSAQELFENFQIPSINSEPAITTPSNNYTSPSSNQNSYASSYENNYTHIAPTTKSRGSAVYYCPQIGVAGWGYGSDYENVAYANCNKSGGVYCQPLLSGNHHGYAAIAVGTFYNGKGTVGVGAGYTTQEAAANRALQECINSGGNNAYVESIWYVDNVTNYKVR